MGGRGRRSRIAARLLLGAIGLAYGSACGRDPSPPRAPRLVVLYATCSVNRAFLGPYDADVRYTPNLARFADQSVVFRRHRTEAGRSGIAFASILTGTQADEHGVFDHPTPLRDEQYLMAEAFADAGYETFFWNAHELASIDLNYGQGVPAGNAIEWQIDDGALLSREPRFTGILERLRAEPDYRAFVQVNFTVTHSPYAATAPDEVIAFCTRLPAECAGLRRDELAYYAALYRSHQLRLQWDFPDTRDELGLGPDEVADLASAVEVLYASCVSELDRDFGDCIDAIDQRGLSGESLVAFTVDHGEVMYRDDVLFPWSHGPELAPEDLDVPLIVRAPGLAAGEYQGVSRSIDVFPTLAGLAGLSIPPERGVRGVDLSPAMAHRAEPPELVAFSHVPTYRPLAMKRKVRNGYRQFLRYYPRTDPELMWVCARKGDVTYELRNLGDEHWAMQAFDLASDPERRVDLFSPSNPEHREMERRVRAYKARLVEAYHRVTHDAALDDDEQLEKLRSLGYVR